RPVSYSATTDRQIASTADRSRPTSPGSTSAPVLRVATSSSGNTRTLRLITRREIITRDMSTPTTRRQMAFVLWFQEDTSSNLHVLNGLLANGWHYHASAPMSGTGEQRSIGGSPESRTLIILGRED